MVPRLDVHIGNPNLLPCIDILHSRKSGLAYFVDIHVEADPEMPLRAAHELSGRIKSAIRQSIPQVEGVLVHMEPAEAPSAGAS